MLRYAAISYRDPAMSDGSGNSGVLRILHVVDSLERGGLERVVTDLAVEQRRAGHEVTVFSILRTAGFLGEIEASGIPVRIGGKMRAFDLGVIRALRAEAKRHDIVNAHNFTPSYYSAVALLLHRRAPAHVVTCHDMGTRLKDRKLRAFFAFSLRRTRRAAMVSRQVRDWYVESELVPADRAVTITNGIPVERFRAIPERRATARHALGLTADALVVGCVGRLVPVKNHALLLECLPRLVTRHANLAVVLVGGGELATMLRERAASLGVAGRVFFAGEQPNVADLLPGFDVFAQPSLSEGLSIALLEASATGLAIVATDVGGNREIVGDGVTGLLVPSGDVDALTTALDRVLSDADLRASFGAAAAKWVERNASITVMREAYDRFYRDALAAR
jgi:glycosyltransferase involved in cell wall biosynthesis